MKMASDLLAFFILLLTWSEVVMGWLGDSVVCVFFAQIVFAVVFQCIVSCFKIKKAS